MTSVFEHTLTIHDTCVYLHVTTKHHLYNHDSIYMLCMFKTPAFYIHVPSCYKRMIWYVRTTKFSLQLKNLEKLLNRKHKF